MLQPGGQHGAYGQLQQRDEAVHDLDSSLVAVVVVYGAVVVPFVIVVDDGVVAAVAVVVVAALVRVAADEGLVSCPVFGPAFSSLPHRESPPRSKSTKFRSVS